jgi:hypothetical protein
MRILGAALFTGMLLTTLLWAQTPAPQPWEQPAQGFDNELIEIFSMRTDIVAEKALRCERDLSRLPNLAQACASLEALNQALKDQQEELCRAQQAPSPNVKLPQVCP